MRYRSEHGERLEGTHRSRCSGLLRFSRIGTHIHVLGRCFYVQEGQLELDERTLQADARPARRCHAEEGSQHQGNGGCISKPEK